MGLATACASSQATSFSGTNDPRSGAGAADRGNGRGLNPPGALRGVAARLPHRSSMAMIVALLAAAIAIVRWQLFPSWPAVAATLAAALTLIDNVSDLATNGTRRGLRLIALATVNNTQG
jgi:hypothetical protein